MEHGRGREGELSLVNLLRAVQERKDLSSNEGVDAMRKIHEYSKKGARFSLEIFEGRLDDKKVPYVRVYPTRNFGQEFFLDLKRCALYYIGTDAKTYLVPEDQEKIFFEPSDESI